MCADQTGLTSYSRAVQTQRQHIAHSNSVMSSTPLQVLICRDAAIAWPYRRAVFTSGRLAAGSRINRVGAGCRLQLSLLPHRLPLPPPLAIPPLPRPHPHPVFFAELSPWIEPEDSVFCVTASSQQDSVVQEIILL